MKSRWIYRSRNWSGVGQAFRRLLEQSIWTGINRTDTFSCAYRKRFVYVLSVRKGFRSGLKERYKCAGREEHRPYFHPGQRSLIFPDRSRFRIITSLFFRHIHQNLDRDKRSIKRLPARGLFLMSKRRNAAEDYEIFRLTFCVGLSIIDVRQVDIL